MKRSFLVGMILALRICLLVQGQLWLGSGTEVEPYLIEDANDMQAIGADPNYWGAHFKLTNGVDLAGYTGTQFNIIGNSTTHFTGVFDGNGHVISNFTFYSIDESYVGIFGYIDTGSRIFDLSVENVNVSGVENVGGLVGYSNYGTISFCSINGMVNGLSLAVGGLVGYNYDSTIINSTSMVSVYGEDTVGGLVGMNYEGALINCYATSDVEAVGYGFAGGLVGESYGPIDGCYATGAVTVPIGHGGGLVGYNTELVANCFATGTVTGHRQCGGLIGGHSSFSNIMNSYSTGTVTATGYEIGGLVGENMFGDIVNCYTTSSVTGDYSVGGLIGNSYDCIVSNSYATGVVSGTIDVGGLVGEDFNSSTVYSACFWNSDNNPNLTGIGNGSDPNVISETTANMQKESTFTGWDFVEIWGIGENQTYPYLRVYPAGDLNHDGRVNLLDFVIFSERWMAGIE